VTFMKISMLLFALLLGPPAAWSQRVSADVLDPVGGRTVEELVRLALQQNGEILAGQQQVVSARADLTQARLRPNPSVDVSGMKERSGPMNSFMVGASIPLELFNRRDRRIEVADTAIRVSEMTQADRERLLRAEVESKFGEVLASQRNLQFTEDLLDLNRKSLELTQARADQGAAPPLDADLLRVEVNRIDSLRADFEARLGVNLLELKSLAGIPPEADLRLKGTLDPQPPAITKDEATARALASRPDLLSLRAAEQVAASKLKQAEVERRPDATLSGSYQRSDSGFALNGITASGEQRRIQGIFNLLTIGVSITLPLRNRNEGVIAAAAAEMEAARRRREYAELIAKREIAAAFLTQEKARESLDIYRVGVRDQAERNLEVIRRVYELGRSQLLDVIAEQRRLIDIETGYTDALNRHYQASVRLRLAAGLE